MRDVLARAIENKVIPIRITINGTLELKIDKTFIIYGRKQENKEYHCHDIQMTCERSVSKKQTFALTDNQNDMNQNHTR